MSIREWWSRIRGSLRRDDALESGMDREMRFHLDMATQRNIERGMTPAEAARSARLAFGNVNFAKESARDAHRARHAENVVADVRYALRAMRRAPGFALATTLTMALGIGASTAIFTVVDAALLRPLPIPHPGDFTYLGWVWEKGGEIPSLTEFQYEFVRANNRAFTGVAAFTTRDAPLGDSTGTAPPLRGLRVAGDFFGTIGFAPRLGRAFDSTELASEAAVVILGDGAWRARFGADSTIIGRRIALTGETHTVIGVMPREYRFPPAIDNDAFLVPYAVRPNPADEGHNTEVIARLHRGTSRAARDADLQALSDRFRAAYPHLAGPHERFKLFGHRDVFVSDLRRTLWMVFGAVSLLLLIACANTATLLLVRASTRQREIAVRASIGAAPSRIVQQLLTEGVVLATLAASLGVSIGAIALRGFLAAAPSSLPAGMSPQLDARALAYAVIISVVTGLVFGLAAAGPSFRLRLGSALVGGARGATAGGTRTREALVFLATSSAMVLVAGATLLTVSFARLLSVHPGFDADRVIAVRIGRLPPGYDATRRDQLVDRLLARIRQLPGVEYAAAAPNLPFERGRNFPVDTRENPERAIGAVELRFVSPDYFATLGVALRGRDFGAGDIEGSERVAIVNETFARHFWDAASPLDRTIQIGHFRDRWLTPRLERQTRVVGLAADMREAGLDRAPRPTVLLPRAQGGDGLPVLLVRSTVSRIGALLRAEISAEEAQLVPQIESLAAVRSRSVAAPRFRALLIGTFAGSALLLAAIGIYGVIAAVVAQRTREIAIRLSLGATRGGVALSAARRCLASVIAGASVGLVAFWLLRRGLTSMLFDVSAGDPRLLAVAVTVLGVVAMCAAWIPARRASHVDPAQTLRLD